MSNNRAKLSVWAFGFAFGIVWAIALLIMGWLAWLSGWGVQMISVIGSVYLGYTPTFWGAIVGAIWGFVDFFIGGVIFAAIYNACTCRRANASDVNAGSV